MLRPACLALAAILLLPLAARAQPAEQLTVPQIMAWGDTLSNGLPRLMGWDETGDALYFRWNPQMAFDSDSLYLVRRGATTAQKAPRSLQVDAPEMFSGWQIGEGVYSADRQRKVYGSRGDVYLMDREAGRATALTQTRDFEYGARFMAGDTAIVYQRGDALFRHSLVTGAITQLTDIRSGREPSERSPDAQQAFLDRQQRELFGYIRDRVERRERNEQARDAADEMRPSPPTFYAGGDNVGQLQVDPTGRWVTFTTIPSVSNERTDVPFWVTESGYTETRAIRPKVGQKESAPTLYVQDLTRDTTYAVDLSNLPRLYETPAYRAADVKPMETASDSARARRPVDIAGPTWSADGRHAILVVRAKDNKTRWVTRLDASTGTVTPLDVQQDDAWIGGPGISSWGGSGTLLWYPDARYFLMQSEATGYSHLYRVDAQTGAQTQLTSGEFEVSDPLFSADGRTITFTSTEHSAHEQHRYSMPSTGGTRTRLTTRVGHHDLVQDPRGEIVAQTFSTANMPPEVYVGDTRVTHSTTPDWERYDWRDAEIIDVPASDGIGVPARIYRPDPANANGAAVLFVHGAGYLHNVHRGWSTYFREYMFHHLLAEQGYTVLDLDYRASAGYGRDWRTDIYRHMGGRDLQDYVDASRYVGSELDIDPERVFIYGGSYGGFITLMALFTEPEHFGGGAALRSVTDWAHYNHGYTANILNTPADDSLAYALSSPINFAEGYQGDPLLIAHGMVDVNVQFQDVARLAQRLIELGKEGWEMAVYPVEDHGFTEPASWTDEYRRILDYADRSVGPRSPHAEQ